MKKKELTGFTLIEILVAVGLIGIIVAIGSGMFFSILKGSTKARVLAEVKENGNYAISVMARMIRNARIVDDYSSDSITIENPDGGRTIFECTDENRIASTSGSISADLISNRVRVKDCNIFDVVEGIEGVRPYEVTIDFTLEQAQAFKAEEKAEVNFKTKVTVRTY